MNATSSHTAIQEPSIYQLDLLVQDVALPGAVACRDLLVQLLSGDLDYHGYDTSYASHDFHTFPAKHPILEGVQPLKFVGNAQQVFVHCRGVDVVDGATDKECIAVAESNEPKRVETTLHLDVQFPADADLTGAQFLQQMQSLGNTASADHAQKALAWFDRRKQHAGIGNDLLDKPVQVAAKDDCVDIM